MVEREIDYTVEETKTKRVTICDECGEEAVGGVVYLPIARPHYDRWKDKPSDNLDTSALPVNDPLYRCSDCLGTAPSVRELPRQRWTFKKLLEGIISADMGAVFIGFVVGFFVGGAFMLSSI
jgi:hypothetical protein